MSAPAKWKNDMLEKILGKINLSKLNKREKYKPVFQQYL